jgi:hypothetical protein
MIYVLQIYIIYILFQQINRENLTLYDHYQMKI